MSVCSGVQATDVQFDVTSTSAGAYTSYCGQTCNVTLQNKTFSAYEWDGAVFPFTASQEVLDATFGEGKWDLQEFDSFDGTTIKMKAATSIVAGTPYAIRVKQTAENPTFNNVTFASSISTDFIKVSLSNDLEFWGTYFKIYAYQIVGGQGNPVTAFSFKSDGSGFGNWRNWGTFREQDKNGGSDDGYHGAFAWFYHPSLNTTTPSLSLDIASSGSGESGGGESGGGDDPTPTSLEGKMYVGLQAYSGGRLGERAAIGLSQSLREHGIVTKSIGTIGLLKPEDLANLKDTNEFEEEKDITYMLLSEEEIENYYLMEEYENEKKRHPRDESMWSAPIMATRFFNMPEEKGLPSMETPAETGMMTMNALAETDLPSKRSRAAMDLPSMKRP